MACCDQDMARDSILAQAIAEQATPLIGAAVDFDLLLDRIGDARFVLLGEATHGSHEFYRIRAELTKRLIRERGFAAIAAEADWPDAYRVNRYVRGASAGRDAPNASEALGDFRRFPQWMWRNADVVDLVGWLRSHNEQIAEPAHRVGFYGLDVYSLHASMAQVIAYLDTRDPEAGRRARERYGCFDAFGEEPQAYGHAVSLGLSRDCEHEVLAQLVDVLERRAEDARRDGLSAEDAQFEAEQNARVVASAEEYYRAMYVGGVSTWNLRDTHMTDTLDALAAHLEHRGRHPKVVVWAHNSHVGDSDAMAHRAERDEITIGHLCRERHPGDTILVGFTTYRGTVTAASSWGAPAERKTVRPALAGSYEALFHATGVPSFLLLLDSLGEATAALHEARLERAIGVVYRPRTERASHYFDVRLADQLDAVIHVDETRALEPLERTAAWERGELPETYPTGL
jgi:erythromycin esterase-like protein